MWKEAVLALFEELPLHSAGSTEELDIFINENRGNSPTVVKK
jgi:hypothetical protein